ncbi:MAG: toxin-antitoxin system protein [Lawsonibacter sp.]|jgi:predicted transcriptional regulator|nr:toxin-antitoxin system protein [Lawsonibacter sp.]
MKPIKTSVSITIDDPILDRVKYLAEREDRSLSSYINLVLRAHLEELDRKKSSEP